MARVLALWKSLRGPVPSAPSMGRSLFITGGRGYVGSALLRRVAPGRSERGQLDRVVCLVRAPGELAERDDVSCVVGDLLEPDSYREAMEGCDTVLHLAAVTGKARPALYERVNSQGTRVLVEACREAGVRDLLSVSTIAAKFRDQTRYFYAHSKKNAEEIVAQSGLGFAIVRPAIVMGPGAPVLEGLARLAGAPVTPVFGDGHTQVQPVWVEDLVDCLLAIILEGRFRGEVIEIGGPDVISIEELLVRIGRVRFGRAPRLLHLPLGPIRALLGLLEPLLLPLLPLTAAQLATFANDGTVAPSAFLDERRGRMAGVDAVLERAFAHG